MKKSRAETSGALSGEFADRVRPPYASDEKRRQAAELFAARDWLPARFTHFGSARQYASGLGQSMACGEIPHHHLAAPLSIFGCRQTKSRAHAPKRTYLA